jgi:hypothetical protein
MNSVAPETEPATHALTPEQNKRRKQLQGVVAGLISGLVSFTALAAVVYAVKRHNEAALVIAEATTRSAPPATLAAAPAGLAQPTPTAAGPSDSDAAPATAPAPVAALASRQPALHAKGLLGTPARPHVSVVRPKLAQTPAAKAGARKLPSR